MMLSIEISPWYDSFTYRCSFFCFRWKADVPFLLSFSQASLCHFISLLLSLHIIMSGRQISTVAIVGPCVYLLTRKDSLYYNRLISLPPRTLISSQMKIETIRAVGGTTFLALQCACHSLLPPQTAVTLTGVVSNRRHWFEKWQTNKQKKDLGNQTQRNREFERTRSKIGQLMFARS